MTTLKPVRLAVAELDETPGPAPYKTDSYILKQQLLEMLNLYPLWLPAPSRARKNNAEEEARMTLSPWIISLLNVCSG